MNFVYVLCRHARLHKIGYTNHVAKRMAELNCGSSEPFTFVKAWDRPEYDARAVESEAHRALAGYRIAGTELFTVTALAACAAVDLATIIVDGLDIRPHKAMPTALSARLAEMDVSRAAVNKVGFLSEPIGHDDAVIRAVWDGLHPDQIYCDIIDTIKTLRPGDIVYLFDEAARGGYLKLPGEKFRAAWNMWADPEMSAREIAVELGIGERTLHRRLGPRGTPAFGKGVK